MRPTNIYRGIISTTLWITPVDKPVRHFGTFVSFPFRFIYATVRVGAFDLVSVQTFVAPAH